MSVFLDSDGKEWRLRLSSGAVADIKRETGVNLGNAGDTSWVSLLFDQPDKLVGVLWVLCRDQAGHAEPEKFGYLFDGPTLSRAGDALAEAVADFFPRSRISQALRKHLATILDAADQKVTTEMEAAATRALESLRPATPSPSATTSPESAGSIPAG